MSAIPITFPDAMLARLSAAAQQAGILPQEFILLAVSELLDRQALPDELSAEADASEAEFMQSGVSASLTDVQDYFQRRVNGESPARPRLKRSLP